MKLTVFVLALVLIAEPVFALSCMRPDVVRLYQNAVESEENYYFIKGILVPEGAINEPVTSGTKEPVSAETNVRFVGEALTRDGFEAPFDRDIILRLNCASIWCGAAPLERKIFAAIKLAGETLDLDIGPCGFDAVDYSEPAEKRLLDCHQNGNCEIDF